MSEKISIPPKKTYNLGRGILLVFSIGNILAQLALLFFDNSFSGFLVMAAFSFVTAMILLIPYRRFEKWAWYTVWAYVITFAFIILFNAEVGIYYLGESIAMALGQSLTFPSFFRE